MTSFATLTWLHARQLRGAALLSLALIAAYALLVAGPERLATYYESMGDFAQPGVSVPMLFGAGIAAPMLAREQQRGTVDLAYTQSMLRARWLAARVLPTLVLAVATMYGVRAAYGLPPGNHLIWPGEVGTSTVRLGFLLYACALGLCAGAVLGRTLPAMAVTVAGFLLVWNGGLLLPLVDLLAPHPQVYDPAEYPRVVWAYGVVLYALAALWLAITFGWMIRKVPRS
ncbi:hypothetical protein [Cryptosporangium sp. NPDC048952]|uniref:hypothetical protein n=1 Tax=Cryptosporangium sp. NPDC048952 TaxID=3363961 RepID=UPI0037129ADE